jgi:hypothetical protein
MPDRRTEHTKQQIRELGQAVRKAAREVDRSYPNTKQGDRAVRDFRHQTNRIVQGNRQSRNRSLGGSYYRSSRSSQGSSGLNLGLVVILMVFVILLMIFFF